PRGHERLRPGHKGLLPTTRPQGAAVRGQAAGGGCPLQGRKGQPRGQGCRLQGQSMAGATASRGSARVRRRRQPARSRPKAAAPAVGAAAHADDMQRRHLRRVAATAVVQMGARRGLGRPFR
ncbi:hypothetical protein GW17_00044092, partial [Ensete ventricosum]